MAKTKRKWIQRALGVRPRRRGLGPHHIKSVRVEAEHPGALHRMLGIPESETIPLEVLRLAAKQPGTLGRRARLALTLRGFPTKKAKHGRY